MKEKPKETKDFLVFLGGSGEIGGPYMLLVVVDGMALVFDCGMRAKSEGYSPEELTPDFYGLCKILVDNGLRLNAMFITHGHLDHVGAVPLGVRILEQRELLHPKFKILMSAPTRAFADWQWRETVNISKKEEQKPPFDWVEIARAKHFIKKFRRPSVRIGKVRVSKYDMGHILGALGFQVLGSKGQNIFLTGDFSFASHPVANQLKVGNLPKGVRTLVGNFTYAGKPLEFYHQARKNFVDSALAHQKAGKKVIIPTFSIRGELIWHMLRSAGFKNMVLDGSVRRIAEVHRRYDRGKNLLGIEEYFAPLYQRGNPEYNALVTLEKERILKDNSVIVIASSGMLMDTSMSYKYVYERIDDPNTVIMFTGYQDPDSPGGKLREMLANRRDGELIIFHGKPVRAKVEYHYLSGHATEKQDAMLATHCFRPNGTPDDSPQKLVLAHCDPPDVDNFLKKFPDIPGEKIVPKNGEIIEI